MVCLPEKTEVAYLAKRVSLAFSRLPCPFLDYPEEIVLAKPRKKRKNLELYAGIGRA